jgi:hypothetical protein
MDKPKNAFKSRPGRLRVGVDGHYSVLEDLAGFEHPSATTRAARGGDGSAATLPCLNTHISIENPPEDAWEPLETPEVQYSKGRQQSAFILSESVQKVCRMNGIERVAFLTLTFSDHITCPRQAQKRLNSLLSNVVKPRYGEYCEFISTFWSPCPLTAEPALILMRSTSVIIVVLQRHCAMSGDFGALPQKNMVLVAQNLCRLKALKRL